MKGLFIMLCPLLGPTPLLACPLCNKAVRDAITASSFYLNLWAMMSTFIVLGITVAALSVLATARYNKKAAGSHPQFLTPVPLTTAATVLGIGMGGFIDGIVLHQLLQVHEMLSARIPATNYVGKSVNMFWDGVFHLFCFLAVLAGIILLWRVTRRNDINHSGGLLYGGLLLGWGTFNIVEGVIDHHLLKLHNVIEYAADHNVANYTFLAVSVAMIIIGYALINRVLYRQIKNNLRDSTLI